MAPLLLFKHTPQPLENPLLLFVFLGFLFRGRRRGGGAGRLVGCLARGTARDRV
jgi:hypothetical protein